MINRILQEMPSIPTMTETGRPAPRPSRHETWLLPDPETVFQATEDGGRVFNPTSQRFVVLDRDACKVWKALGAGTPTIRVLTERLIPESDPKHYGMRCYIYELLMALISRGFITDGPPPRSGAADNVVHLFQHQETQSSNDV